MQNVSIRLGEDLVAALDEEAEHASVSRTEHIRNTLAARDEYEITRDEHEALQAKHDALQADYDTLQAEYDDVRAEHTEELDALREEYESEIDYLNTQIERLQRTNLKILEQRDETTELQRYVDTQQEWEQANWLTRQKWKLFGKEKKSGSASD